MTELNRDACELSDQDLDHVAGGKGTDTTSFWTALGSIVLGPMIGTAIGKAIGKGAGNGAEDAA